MANYQTDLGIQSFRGIRAVNPVVDVTSSGQISASVCKNVELKFSGNGNNVGIFTMKGSSVVAELEGKVIRGHFESVQLGISYQIVYATDENGGYLYWYKPGVNTFQLLHEGLTATKQCNGLTLNQGYDDVFVFTNGVDDYLSVLMKSETNPEPTITPLNATDAEERPIRGLCLKYQNGRLITNSGNRVHWSKTVDIYDWSSAETGVYTNPAYQEFDRDITAIETYGDALIVFTDTYSAQFTGNPGNATEFKRSDATGGGCSGFEAVIKFDNKVFYYDPTAKNIFAYYLYDSGQTRPTDGLANDIIKYLSQVDQSKANEFTFKTYIYGDKSEIWIKFTTFSGQIVLIYDYLKQEWLMRDMPLIDSISTINSQIYTSVGGRILKEYSGNTYNGDFVPSEYKCNIINLNSDSNLKIPKLPIIITFDNEYTNNLWMELTLDDDPTKVILKRIEKSGDEYLIWASEDGSIGGIWANDDGTDGYYWNYDDSRNVTYNLFGLIPYKQLQIRFFTEKLGDEFGIKRIEIKRVKVKTKTVA